MAWRYYAQRIIGGAWLNRDLEVLSPQITWGLSSPGELSFTVGPDLASAVALDGYLVIDEWSTAIYVEDNDGIIQWGGIVTSSDEGAAGTRNVTCHGFTTYPKGRAYVVEHKKYYQADPFDIIRYLWTHMQSQPLSDLGVVLNDAKSKTIIGTEDPGPEPKRSSFPAGDDGQKDYDKAHAAWEQKPSEPFELAWWDTPDIGDKIEELLTHSEGDFIETHEWADNTKNAVIHRVNLYAKDAAATHAVRSDLRFVEGENIVVSPDVSRDGEEYANWIVALGVGEERHKIRAWEESADPPRLRRDIVLTLSEVKNQTTLQAAATKEWKRAIDMVKLDSIDVIEHPNAPIASWSLGDIIQVKTYVGFENLDRKLRITSWTVDPNQPDKATLTLTKA
jgi:hypothetical protein